MPFQTEHLRTSFLAATMVVTIEEKKLATNHTQNHARQGRSAACFNLLTLSLEPCVQVPGSWWKLAFPDWIDLCDLGRAWAVEYGPPRNGPDSRLVWALSDFTVALMGYVENLDLLKAHPNEHIPHGFPTLWMFHEWKITLNKPWGN